jgi:hypothetical protein
MSTKLAHVTDLLQVACYQDWNGAAVPKYTFFADAEQLLNKRLRQLSC